MHLRLSQLRKTETEAESFNRSPVPALPVALASLASFSMPPSSYSANVAHRALCHVHESQDMLDLSHHRAHQCRHLNHCAVRHAMLRDKYYQNTERQRTDTVTCTIHRCSFLTGQSVHPCHPQHRHSSRHSDHLCFPLFSSVSPSLSTCICRG